MALSRTRSWEKGAEVKRCRPWARHRGKLTEVSRHRAGDIPAAPPWGWGQSNCSAKSELTTVVSQRLRHRYALADTREKSPH